MKKKKIATYAALLALLLALLTGCAQKTVQNNDSPITDESAGYQARIEELEAELQKQKEERYISDAAYTATIQALQSKLDALAPDIEAGSTQVETGDELVFSYRLEGGKAVITGYKGTSTLVTVPAALDGYPVIAIGERAFERQRIAAVILPQGLEAIGWFAFYGCEGLIDVSIPPSVTSIGYAVFDGCESVSIICASGSYAEQYAISYGLPHITT
ncbi:MAG: leucine-rich repeat protein [Clostridia bacterium]|nr:leucine-rich repeat protein [Clostridia bacterium]